MKNYVEWNDLRTFIFAAVAANLCVLLSQIILSAASDKKIEDLKDRIITLEAKLDAGGGSR